MSRMIIFLLTLLIVAACGPQKRLNRLLDHHAELKRPDTIIVQDTVTTQAVTKDTALPISRIRDTVFIEKGKLQILLKKVRDTLLIRGKCKADTVIIRKSVPINRIQYVKSSPLLRIVPWLVVAGIAMLVFLFLRRL